jgi:hypothetical protein
MLGKPILHFDDKKSQLRQDHDEILARWEGKAFPSGLLRAAVTTTPTLASVGT